MAPSHLEADVREFANAFDASVEVATEDAPLDMEGGAANTIGLAYLVMAEA